MFQLARIKLNKESQGDDVSLRACDVSLIERRGSGALVTLDNGRTYEVTETVTAVHDAIDALWTEYNTALTGV